MPKHSVICSEGPCLDFSEDDEDLYEQYKRQELKLRLDFKNRLEYRRLLREAKPLKK